VSSDSDSSSEEEKPKKKVAPKKKVVSSDSDSSSEEEKPKRKTSKAAKKQAADSSDSSSEEEKPARKASSKPASRKQSKKQEEDDFEETEVFVGNMPWSANEDSLTQRFSAFGTVNIVKMLYNEQGQSRGIAFIKMSSSQAAKRAVDAENGNDYDGRPLRCNLSADKSQVG